MLPANIVEQFYAKLYSEGIHSHEESNRGNHSNLQQESKWTSNLSSLQTGCCFCFTAVSPHEKRDETVIRRGILQQHQLCTTSRSQPARDTLQTIASREKDDRYSLRRCQPRPMRSRCAFPWAENKGEIEYFKWRCKLISKSNRINGN